MRLWTLLLIACNQDIAVKETSRCDGKLQGDESTVDAPYDEDGDGAFDASNLDCAAAYTSDSLDCDDSDASIHPGADELSCTGIDEDCDARTPDAPDADGDGVTACEDCDDSAAAISPDRPESCNGRDDDCNGQIDDGVGSTFWTDADEDGAGDPEEPVIACEAPEGAVANDSDCDDADNDAYPGNTEVCDGVDNDCDGEIDEGVGGAWFEDADGDGYGDPGSVTAACEAPAGTVADGTDCDDRRDSINPGAPEQCNGVDDDCNGLVDEAGAIDESDWYLDADGDAYGSAAVVLTGCDDPGSSWVANDSDCDDGDLYINPAAAEVCNGYDDDCDARVDGDDPGYVGGATWYLDRDGDGYGDPTRSTLGCSAPAGYVADATDCDDLDGGISPAAAEICDTVDNDCDGLVDDDDPSLTGADLWYVDADSDGFGDPASAELACAAPPRHVADASDCDDGNAGISPIAGEVCNRVDDDCDGLTDDADPSVSGSATFYADTDGDGYGDPASPVTACSAPAGTTADGSDCAPSDASIHPGAAEICDAVDQDCDGSIDDGVLGTGPACAAEDCLEILLDQPGAASGDWSLTRGTYYCDMTTDGGGWTEVADAVPVFGTGYDTTYYNQEAFRWSETLFAYNAGSVHAHCDYPSSLTGCNDLGFQFANENWGVPLNWGSSICGMATTDYTGATRYPAGYDFVISRATSSDTIRLGTLEGIANCTTTDNPGTAYVDLRVR